MVMNGEYFVEGYNLMMDYMRVNRILTKERNFRRRLDKFYNKHKDEKMLMGDEEFEYLELEKYFYNNILAPTTTEEQALTNMLNIFTNLKYKMEEAEDKINK